MRECLCRVGQRQIGEGRQGGPLYVWYYFVDGLKVATPANSLPINKTPDPPSYRHEPTVAGT